VESLFPTLKRGANKLCASGALVLFASGALVLFASGAFVRTLLMLSSIADDSNFGALA
jgi:hypothetical protein